MPAPSRTTPSGPIQLTVEQADMARVARVLREQADGKDLRKAFIKDLRRTTTATVVDLKQAIRSTPSRNLTQGTSLRSAVSARIRPVVRLSGKQTGVSIQAGQTPGLRGFKLAARRFNRASFRHPVYGDTSTWVAQVGKPRWWDDTTRDRREDFRRDVLIAVEQWSREVARRAGGS